MNKQDFINSIKEGAVKGWRDYGILPSLTIAQAILESGWGSSELTRKANNLFGVKVFSDWKGNRISMPTVEWYNGQRQMVSADFRAYDSLNASIEDHTSCFLMRGMKLYGDVLITGKLAKEYINAGMPLTQLIQQNS